MNDRNPSKEGLVQEDGCIHIEIRDWGIGFDPDRVEERCFGLAGIRERARVLGGHAAIRSVPGEGTRIVVRLPVRVSEVVEGGRREIVDCFLPPQRLIQSARPLVFSQRFGPLRLRCG
jgi:hypothetical protein